MSTYIDLDYINRISPRLQNFKKKREYLFNFRCPVCGDSKKSKSKARAYLYRVKTDMFFKCHNCGASHNLANFIKLVDSTIHNQYILDRFKGGKPKFEKSILDKFKDTTKARLKTTPLRKLKAFSDIDDKHPAKQYLIKRKIPEKYFSKLFLCNKFQEYVNGLRPGTYSELNKKYEHPRLIIPFYDVNHEAFALQGRAFGKEIPKYVTLKLDDSKQKIFGLDRADIRKRLYIVEGPIDSLFIDNCIAAAGADIHMSFVSHNNVVFVFDNEPRNKEIINRMYKAIDKNFEIVIWPNHIKEKDINDMILSGKSKQDIQYIINQNTYSGLSALTQLNIYKRI